MWIWMFFTLAGLCACTQAAPITLARGGRPAATIVLPPDAPEPLATAALEMQSYARKLGAWGDSTRHLLLPCFRQIAPSRTGRSPSPAPPTAKNGAGGVSGEAADGRRSRS